MGLGKVEERGITEVEGRDIQIGEVASYVKMLKEKGNESENEFKELLK
jgi:hypothetical protein